MFSKIKNSNHFFKSKEKDLTVEIEKYLKEKTFNLNFLLNPSSAWFNTSGRFWKRYR